LLETLAAAIEGTPFALWAARDPLAYPVANVIHVLGLALLLGPILLADLKLLGAFPALPLQPFVRAVRPFAVAGLVAMILSGSVLFAADAVALATSGTFRLKLLLVGMGLANALAFPFVWRGEVPAGAGARAMATASIGLWAAAAVAGRWIAYAA
jgi:hypothetical protein